MRRSTFFFFVKTGVEEIEKIKIQRGRRGDKGGGLSFSLVLCVSVCVSWWTHSKKHWTSHLSSSGLLLPANCLSPFLKLVACYDL